MKRRTIDIITYWAKESGRWYLLPTFAITFERVGERNAIGAELYLFTVWFGIDITWKGGKRG